MGNPGGKLSRLSVLAGQVAPPDHSLITKAQARLDRLTKPQGSLGVLEAVARQVVGTTGRMAPLLGNKVVFIFAADHGVVAEGVSAYPPEVTSQMVLNFLAGGAAVNVLARHANARVVVADLGINGPVHQHPDLVVDRIGNGTRNFSRGPAMTGAQARASIEAGIRLAEAEIGRGADLIATGEMGIGNTASASAIVAAMTRTDPAEVTGHGTGIAEGQRLRKVEIIRRGLEINRPDPSDPLDVLAKVGGFEIGGMAGAMVAGAAYRVPVIVDGFISAAAALIACGLAPAVREHLIAGHRSAERGHAVALKHLMLTPLLTLDMRLGEGTGAVLAMHLVEAACKLLRDMATFESAEVSGPSGDSVTVHPGE